MADIKNIAEKFKVIIFSDIKPEYKDLCAELMDSNKRVFVLANTSGLAEEVEESYFRQGIKKDEHYMELLTSGEYAAEIIRSEQLMVTGYKFWVFGTANEQNPEIGFPLLFSKSMYWMVDTPEKADFIYCGMPLLERRKTDDISEFMPELKKLAQTGKPMVCVNPNILGYKAGKLFLEQGAIADAYHFYGGRVIAYGKPYIGIFERLIRRCCPTTQRHNILMIGDNIQTDIVGARLADIKSCWTVSGLTAALLDDQDSTLEDFLAKQKVRPDFIVE